MQPRPLITARSLRNFLLMSHTRDVRCHVVASLIAFSMCLADDQSIDYVRDIQPILKQHVINVTTRAKQVSGTHLIVTPAPSRVASQEPPAIVAGKPSESELIKRLMTADIDERMPPRVMVFRNREGNPGTMD